MDLIFDAQKNLPAVLSDEAKVSQILRNFVSNAAKFTERGEVRVAARWEGDHIIFSVADTGIGIHPDHVERIFEEFAQLDSPIQRKVKGTGLGLPLCRKLAGLLGGSVSVESRPGVGSTSRSLSPWCTLRSPRPPQSQPSEAARRNRSARRPGRRRKAAAFSSWTMMKCFAMS